MRWISGAARLRPSYAPVVVFLASVAAGGQAAPPTSSAPAAIPVTAPPPALIIIDAAHGGTDPGAILAPGVVEKDVTLALARRLRQNLSVRGIAAQLVREGDSTILVDNRAGMVNSANPALYIALHASATGKGIRVFTAMLPDSGDDRGPFANWTTAQSRSLERSRSVQQQLVAVIQKTGFPVRGLVAPLRPLNNAQPPAIAVEIAPTTGDPSQLGTSDYQQMVCAALANALAPVMGSLRTATGKAP